MKYALAVLLIASLAVLTAAEQIVISLEEAVKSSDLVVVGTLNDVAEETRDGVDYGNGEITVEEVLSGTVEAGRKLSLVWQNQTDIDCPRVEHRGQQGMQLVWLLRLKKDGKVAADNEGYVVPLEKKKRVLALLREAGKL